MPRTIDMSNAGSTIVTPYQTAQGGTGGQTVEELKAYLKVISEDQIGQPGGPLPLGEPGAALDPKYLTGISLASAAIDGDTTILAGETKEYFLTTYDAYTTYTVSGVLGTATIDKNVVTYTAGSVDGVGGFIINGRRIMVTISGGAVVQSVNTPSIVSPVEGSMLSSIDTVIGASAFGVNTGTDTHASSDWELATDNSFTTIVQSSTDDTTNLTSWSVTGMLPGTTHYARTRQRGAKAGVSAWSPTLTFKTRKVGELFITGKIVSSDGGDPLYGDLHISDDGNTALVGSRVYVRNGDAWEFQAVLLRGDQTPITVSASALSGDGNSAIVGESNYMKGDGVAYLYKRTGATWSLIFVINPYIAAGRTNRQLGLSVAISHDGNVCVVGCGNSDGYFPGAYIYYTGLVPTTYGGYPTLSPSVDAGSSLGWACAISGDGTTVFLSAPTQDVSYGTTKGKVYVYSGSGDSWSQVAGLRPSDVTAGNSIDFGGSVVVSKDGSTALIAARNDSIGNAYGCGCVYVFTKSNGWTQQAKLVASDFANGDGFGSSVAISRDGNTALIGCDQNDDIGNNSGSAYIFTRSGTVWTQLMKLSSPDIVAGAKFGYSAALSGDGKLGLVGVNSGTGVLPAVDVFR